MHIPVNLNSPVPPPVLRKLVLISTAALLLFAAMILAGDARFSSAQTVLVDYDLDNDGLIEVSNANQWRAIHYDLNGDGTPESRSAPWHGTNTPWATGFPNAMTAAGCPPRDHDNDPATADQASCIGYELISDIDLADGGSIVIGPYSETALDKFTAKLVGNGFRLSGVRRHETQSDFTYSNAAISEVAYSATIEGLGVIGPDFHEETSSPEGGITARLEGKLIGSYVEGGWIRSGISGGLVGRVATHATDGYGVFAHSYVRGTRVGNTALRHGGLVGQMEHQRGTGGINKSTCLNSYFSGDVDQGQRGLVVGDNQNGQGRYINCVGDSTTDANDGGHSTTATGAGAGTIAATNAVMTAASGYTGPFAGWDDYPLDGTITPLDATEPRVDVWYFGDETNLPVLKGWGHDMTLPLDRSKTGTDTVNLCTRTLAVANEIIRHLKDDVRRAGITSTPADMMALTPCTSSADTREVTVTHLTNLVVTNADHTFNLRPDRTFPAAMRLTALDWDDFEYLTNAGHFDLGGNDIEALPPRIFQGLPLRYVDLSNNKLTALHPDLFAGVATVTEVGGNSLLLNGNQLTDTGLPGRIFDSLPHLNGLDLSDNSLTRINTRWFEKLVNLGGKPSASAPYTHALGLHLAGNTVADHYYSNKLFTGVLANITPYVDTAGPNVSAGDGLRMAIETVIAAPYGGRTVANLALTGTDYWFNAGGTTTGYQAASVTSCLSTQSAGPGRYGYVGGDAPDCQIQPHWTPPHKSTDTAATAPSISASGALGSISVQFSHAVSATFVAYLLRWRPSADEPWQPWQVAPITLASGTKSVSAPAPESGVAYAVQLRVLTTTGPPSTPVAGTATTTPANWVTGFSAATGTTTIGTIALSWNAISSGALPSNHSVVEYYYRYKPQSDASYGTWLTAGTGTSHTIPANSLTPDTTYSIQLVGAIDGTDADSDAEYFTNRSTTTATAYAVPADLSATGGTAPGTINVTWTQQTVAVTSQAKIQIRRKLKGQPWPATSPFGWEDVPDDPADSGTDQHDETSHTFAWLRGGAEYDIEVRVHQTDALGALTATPATATATAAPTPTGLSATTGNPGAFSLTWDSQSDNTSGNANYEIRYRYQGEPWPTTNTEGWATISGSSHSSTSHSITGLLNNRKIDVELRFHWNDTIGNSAAATVTATTGAVAAPTGLMATAARGTMALAWTTQIATNNSEAGYQVRYKKATDSWPTAGNQGWTDISGSTHATNSHTVTGVEGVSHNFEIRFVWSNALGASAPAAVTATPLTVTAPTGLNATAGSDPGQVSLSWTRQTTVQTAVPYYQFRYRISGQSWPTDANQGWARIPSSNHATNSYSFDAPNGQSIEVQIRFHYDGPSAAVSDTVTTNAVAAISTFNATATYGTIDLSWTAQTATTNTQAKYEVRYKKSSESWATIGSLGWVTVSGSDHSTNSHEINGGTGLDNVPYDVELRFHWNDAVGASTAASATVTPTAVPAVAGLNAETSILQGQINVSWTQQSTVTEDDAKFQVRTLLDSAIAWGAWTDVADSSDTGMHTHDEAAYTFTGLGTRRTYDIEARIVIGDVEGPIARVNDITSGYQPRGLRAVTGSTPGTIDLTWTKQTQVTGQHQRFVASAKPSTSDTWGSWNEVTDSTDADSHTHDETGYQLTGLKNNVEYDVRVMFMAHLTNRNAWPWNDLEFIPRVERVRAKEVAAPTGLTATAARGAMALAWDAQTATTNSEADYQVRYKKATDSWPTDATQGWTDISGSDHSTNSYTVTGVEGVSHNFEIRFVWSNALGASAPAAVTATPLTVTAPASLTATAGSDPGQISLSWPAQTAVQTSVPFYQFRYRIAGQSWPTDSTQGWARIPGSDHSTNSYSFDAPNGQNIEVQIRFHYTGPSAAVSDTVTTTAVAAISTFNATATYGAINLSWTAQTATTNTQAKYEVRYKKSSADWPATSPFGWADVPSSTHATATHTVTGLEGGSAYNVELRFHWNNAVGASAAAAVTATPLAVPAVDNLNAVPSVTWQQIDVTWTAQTSVTAANAKYQVRARWSVGGTWIGWQDVPDSTADADAHAYNESAHTITGLTPYRLHDVEVRFVVGTHLGPATRVSNVRAGYHPQGMTAAAGDAPGTIDVSWTQQTIYTESWRRFHISTKLSSASMWQSWINIADETADSHQLTGLNAGELYDVRMMFNTTGEHNWPDTNYIPTLTGIRAGIVQPPVNFTAAASTNAVNAVRLSWDAQTASMLAASKFQYRYKLASATWGSQTWNDVDDGGTTVGDSDASHYNETSVNVTGLTANTSYDFQLRFFWNSTYGNSTSVPATATSSTIPAPPNFMASSGTAAGTVDLSWDLVTDATKYQYQYKPTGDAQYPTSGSGAWTDVPDSASDGLANESSLTVTGLAVGDSFDFQVRAHTASANGPAAAQQTATAQTQAPPTGLTATAGTNPGELTISWTAPSVTPATHTGFEFRYKRTAQAAYPSSWTDVPDSGSNGRSDETSYTIASLWAGVSYDVQIRAESNDGPSTPGMGTTATATAQVVAAPTSFTASSGTGPGEIDLSWNVLASSGLPSTPGTPAVSDAVVRYEYRYKLNSATSYPTTGAGAWAQVPDQDDPADGQADETSYTITGLTAYTAYDVELRAAIHDNDEGTATTAEYTSASASDTNTLSGLAIPAPLQATGGTNPGEIALTWTAQTAISSGFSAAKYQFRTKLATTTAWTGVTWSDIPGSGLTTASHTITGLPNRQAHDVQVRFVPSSSLMSDPAQVRGTPTAVRTPTTFRAVTSTSAAGAVDLSWDAQMDSTDSSSQHQYRIKADGAAWPSTSTMGWTDIGDSDDTNSHTYDEDAFTVTGLSAGTLYDVELRFFWTTAVGASTAATKTATASAIPAPPNFSATSGSVTDTVDLSWDAVSGITKYQYRSRLMGADWPATSPFGWADIPDGTDTGSSLADETSYTVTGLTGGMTYDFELRAHTAAATFGPSSSDSANAQPQSPPTSYTATTGTNPGEIDLGWTAPAGSTHTGFQYRHKRTGQADSAYIDWADVPDSASDGRANETAYTITSLWAGVGYTVQIRAQSGSGASEPGASTTATATAKEVAAPTTLNATTGDGPGEIDITWTAITTGLPTGDAVVQYQYRTKLPSASWPTSAPLGWTNIPAASTTSHTITGLTAYTLYDIQLRAAIDDGTDTTGEPPKIANYHSEAVSATGARSGLARPANLRAAGGTNPGEIALTWDAQTAITTGFSAAKYQYRARLASPTASWPSGGGWTDVPSSRLTTASYTLTDLMNGRQHDVEVRFVPSSSLMSAAATVRGTTTVVAVPAGFAASTAAATAGAIDLTWTAQTATSGSDAKYQYRRKSTATGGPTVGWPADAPYGWTDIADSGTDGAHNESSLTFTGLTAGVSYHVELRFHWSNAVGASAATATLTARASDVPIPGSFTASSGSDAGEIDLSWSAVTSATYEYRYKLASVSNYPTSGAGFWASAGSGTSYTITGLTARSSYHVQLRAVVSGSSSQPTATATAQAQTTPGPANLTFSHGPNPGDIKIDWARPALPAPVTHYEFRYKLATAATYPSSGAGHWAEVPDSGDTGTLQSDETTYTISGLQAGKSYHVQVRVFANQAIQYSLPQLGTQAARPVPPPTSFSASGGTNPGEVNLSWTAPAGVTVLRYELRHRLGATGAWSSWTSATASPYTYTGLLAGMSRTFEVRAVMQTVGSSASVSTTGTPTPVPTPASFTATTGTFPGEIDLSWMAVNGATSYEYRYTLSSNTVWPDNATWQSVAATVTSTTITLLEEGVGYTVELRAAITNVGKSTTVATGTASARGADFTASDARPSPPAIPSQYAVDAATIPGRIAITLPGGTDPFIYRHRTANPGQWSRWYKVTPQASENQFLIPDLVPGVEYQIQVRAYTGPGATMGFTTPLTATAQAAPLVAAEDFTASESSGVILLQWSSPALYTPDYYEYRTKPTGTQTWSEWIRVDHEGDRGSTQRKWVTGLESGISHDFELRMQTGAGPSPIAKSSGSARLRIAEVHSIRPTVREVSVRVGDTIALTVDIYDGQEVLDNSIPDKEGSKLVFRWEDKLADGSTGSADGTFATPNNERRVTYTAPSSPGRYIVTAEAQPDGVCTSHHEGAAEITDAERAQCTATFTIRVSGIPAVQAPRPDPVDPTGAIPTSMTDDKGGTYTVFTPTKGGTFTGTDITVSAPAGAIPDRTVVGIGAAVSDIETPDPIPGATMSLAGSYYDINAIADNGEPPIPSYTLNEPATACLPFPDEFRADLSNVVLVQRKSSGDLSILSTKIRSNAGDLTVCGTLTQLPATVAVARLGLVPAPTQTTPTTPADTPDTGATTPGYTLLLITLLAGALVLTGMCRIRRIIL